MKKEPAIDLIRVTANILVITVHFFLNTEFYDMAIQGPSTLISVIIRTFSLICVPLFILLTGYLMNKKELSYSFYKKLGVFLRDYFVLSIVIYLCRIGLLNETIDPIDGFIGLFDYSTGPYAWYVEMYICLFLLIPFLNLIWNNLKNQKQHGLLLGTLVLITIMASLNSLVIIFPSFWTTMYPITYYFTGCYINKYQDQIKKYHLVGAFFLALLISSVHNYAASFGGVFKWEDYNDYHGYQAYFISIIFFVMMLKLKIPDRTAKFFGHLATYSFSIYMLSYVFDQLVYPVFLKWVPSYSNQLILILVPVLSVYLGAYLTAFVLKKLRLVS